jgi:hypothetical protein
LARLLSGGHERWAMAGTSEWTTAAGFFEKDMVFYCGLGLSLLVLCHS